VSAAVEPFVMMADDRSYFVERSQPRTQRVADDRMLAHHLRLLGVELAVFEQHAIGNGDLADVVEEAAPLERREIALVEPERPTEPRRVPCEPLTMAVRRRVARLNR